MSDIDTSGAPTMAPTETAGTTPPVVSSGTPPPAFPPAPPPIGTFGSTRGSGLARGKRPAPAAASASASAAPAGYKPSALEVIVSKSEYKNPFTAETSVGAPSINEPAPQAANLETPAAFPT